MPEESQAPVTDAKEPEVKAPVEQEPETLEALKAKLAEAERKAANKAEEAERHFKKLAKFEEEEKKRQEAELSELEKANKKAAELESELKRLKVESLKKDIAAKVGVPASLAARLQGETPDEIEADAKAILDTLPKPAAVSPTNPGGNSSVKETDAERKRRLGI